MMLVASFGTLFGRIGQGPKTERSEGLGTRKEAATST